MSKEEHLLYHSYLMDYGLDLSMSIPWTLQTYVLAHTISLTNSYDLFIDFISTNTCALHAHPMLTISHHDLHIHRVPTLPSPPTSVIPWFLPND